MEKKVTVFKNIWSTTEPMFINVVEVLKRIKDGNSKELINKIRDCDNKDERDNYKKRLPSICFSGRFSERNSESLLEHSGLICLDIDELKESDIPKIRESIEIDSSTMACFISPSGKGLKVIVKINDSIVYHKGQFLSLEQHFNEILKPFGAEIDKSGKDVNRVCYESYDQDTYYNEDSDTWEEVLEEVEEKKEVSDPDIVISLLQKWMDSKWTYAKGQRNDYLYRFGSALCRYGIDKNRAFGYLSSNYPDYPVSELKTNVDGAYKANNFGTEEFTTEQKKNKIASIQIKETKNINAFWSINDKGKVLIDANQFIKFISALGYAIYMSDPSDENWKIVKVSNMIVDIVSIKYIKDDVLNYVEKHAPDPVYQELNMKNRYFEKTFLNALPLIEVEQIRDKKNSSYIFFEKFFYEIDADKIKKRSYIDLEGRHIWRQQISKNNIEQLTNYQGHDFQMFVWNISGQDEMKYKSICTSIGYLIHTYKDPSNTKAIYASDNSMGELDGMAEGGSGKDLLMKSISQLRSVVEIDGKDFDKRDKFKFQLVQEYTQVVLMGDYEGDIKELFNKITGQFPIEKKAKDTIQLSFENSPKFYISSNTSPQGFSSSFKRRTHSIEFSNHYSDTHQPIDEFGRNFFGSEWTQDDYNKFYTFLFDCIMMYFKDGLIEVVNTENRQLKQMIKNLGLAFTEYFADYVFEDFENGRELIADYRQQTEEDISNRDFYSKLKKLAGIKGMIYKEEGKGYTKRVKIYGKV